MSGRGLKLAANRIDQHQLLLILVKTVNLNLVHTRICSHHIFVIRRPARTGDMRAEIPFCHAPHSFMEDTIHNSAYTAVLAQPQDCGFPVMIARNKNVFVSGICR